MVGSSLVFLTPAGAVAMLACVLPLASLALASRRERAARAALRLAHPPRVRRAARIVGLAAVPVLLGLAAMQPALRTTEHARVRTDAQAYFVVDVTRSMLAASRPGGATRLQRARRIAIDMRDAISEVPSGIATVTDRAVPNLFPSSDLGQFALTMKRAVAIEQPPPTLDAVVATNLSAVGALGTQNFFSAPPAGRKRVVVLLTDGESRGFDAGPVGQALAAGPGADLVIVRIGSNGESVWDGSSRETGYHEDPSSGDRLASLASAAGGKVFAEGSTGAATRAIRSALGSGPTVVHGRTTRTRTLAPWVALLALVPLLLVLPRLRLRGVRSALRLSAGTRKREQPAATPVLGGGQ